MSRWFAHCYVCYVVLFIGVFFSGTLQSVPKPCVIWKWLFLVASSRFSVVRVSVYVLVLAPWLCQWSVGLLTLSFIRVCIFCFTRISQDPYSAFDGRPSIFDTTRMEVLWFSWTFSQDLLALVFYRVLYVHSALIWPQGAAVLSLSYNNNNSTGFCEVILSQNCNSDYKLNDRHWSKDIHAWSSEWQGQLLMSNMFKIVMTKINQK